MGDLLKRLRDCDRNSVQSMLGSRIFGEAADAIEALQRQLAERDALLGECAETLGTFRRRLVSGGFSLNETVDEAKDIIARIDALTKEKTDAE